MAETQSRQLYSLTKITLMQELETLPTDLSDLNDIVVFFKYLKKKIFENLEHRHTFTSRMVSIFHILFFMI
jgi:hypothetical protein